MNSYELSRKWFDWCFDNASKIRPIHTALFFFIIEHNNRLGWKKEFGLPRDMAMDAIGVKNNKTYSGAFNDLEKWKFIQVITRSKNQYSANIISLFGCVKNTPATTSALDEAMLKHLHKQSVGTALDIVPINKPNNIETNKPNNYSDKEFLSDWNKTRTEVLNKPSHLSRLAYDEKDLVKGLKSETTIQALKGFFKQQVFPNGQDYTTNVRHFLNHYNKYLQAYHDKNANIYGKE